MGRGNRGPHPRPKLQRKPAARGLAAVMEQWPTILSAARAEIVELVRQDFAERKNEPKVFNGDVLDAVRMCGVVAGGIGVGALAERELDSENAAIPTTLCSQRHPFLETKASQRRRFFSSPHATTAEIF